jgi:hypothetical protein
MNIAVRYRDRIDESLFLPRVNWRQPVNRRQPKEEMATAGAAK